ncbi:hypothetical protein GW17_00020281, partial [Ensete ventricosum]
AGAGGVGEFHDGCMSPGTYRRRGAIAVKVAIMGGKEGRGALGSEGCNNGREGAAISRVKQGLKQKGASPAREVTIVL